MAAGAHFRIDQASNPIPTGTTDVARTDLRQAVVSLVGDSSSLQNNPVWTIAAFPPGSAGTQPSNRNTFNATFTPDVPGTYLLTFTVNGGGGINSKQFVAAVTFTATGLLIDDGVREPAFGEGPGDDNSGSNTRSWAPAYESGMRHYVATVATYAALRARIGYRQTQVQLLGRGATGDGGEGTFYWDSASTAEDDDGTVLQPTGLATGRWVRIFKGPVSAQWFGARNDLIARTDVSLSGNTMTSATGGFSAGAQTGASVVVEGAKTRNCSGTFAITNSRRGVVGTSTKATLELWEGAPFKINGVQHTISLVLTGTFQLTSGSNAVVGVGSFATNEMFVGQEVQFDFDRKYLVASITNDTHFSLDRTAPEYAQPFTVVPATNVFSSARQRLHNDDIVQVTTTGTLPAPLLVSTDYHVIATDIDANGVGTSWKLSATQGGSEIDITTAGTGVHTFHRAIANSTARQVELDDTHILLDTNANATLSGLTATGSPNPLIATVTGVPNATTLTLNLSADIAVTGARGWIGTDSTPAMAEAMDHGEVEIPAGDYLLATSWQVSQANAHARWMPGARFFVASRIELNADKAKFTGPFQGLDVAPDPLAQLVWIGNTSPRDTTLVLSGIGAGSNSHVVEGMCLDVPAQGTGATGMMIGRLGTVPTSGTLLHNVGILDFQTGLDVGGLQTGTLQKLWVIRRPNSGNGRSTGDGVRLGAYLEPGMGSAQCVVATGRMFDGLIGGFARNIVCGGRTTTDGTVSNWTIDNIFVGGNNPQPHDLDFLIRYTFDVTLRRMYCIHSEEDNRFSVQLGAPSGSAGSQARPDNVRIVHSQFGGNDASIVGYSWQSFEIYGNIHGCRLNCFKNYGNSYFRLAGKWGVPITAAFVLDPTTDIDDPTTGFDTVDALNTNGGNFAPSFTQYNTRTFHVPTIDGAKTINDATSATAAWTFSSTASLTGNHAPFNWTADPGNFAYFHSDIGLFVLADNAASPGTTTVLPELIIRGQYWDGTANRDYPIVMAPFIFDRGLTGTFVGALELGLSKALDAHTAAMVFGLGITQANELYLGPAAGTEPHNVRNTFAMGTTDPETAFVGIPGSLRTGPNGEIWTKATGTGNTGWQGIAVPCNGSPEGVITARLGMLALDYTNGEVYVKHVGSGNTGWKLITHA